MTSFKFCPNCLLRPEGGTLIPLSRTLCSTCDFTRLAAIKWQKQHPEYRNKQVFDSFDLGHIVFASKT